MHPLNTVVECIRDAFLQYYSLMYCEMHLSNTIAVIYCEMHLSNTIYVCGVHLVQSQTQLIGWWAFSCWVGIDTRSFLATGKCYSIQCRVRTEDPSKGYKSDTGTLEESAVIKSTCFGKIYNVLNQYLFWIQFLHSIFEISEIQKWYLIKRSIFLIQE